MEGRNYRNNLKTNKIMTIEEFQAKQSQMSNEELISLAKEEVNKLCKTGGKSITMCVPPSVKDTDMLLYEVIKRLECLTI